MFLDANTIRNLELFPSSANTPSISLFFILNQTRTAMGGRLLKSWLGKPLLSLPKILARQNAIAELVINSEAKSDLQEKLSFVSDLERLSGKIGYGKATPKDLLGLKESLKIVPLIQKQLTALKSPLLKSIKDNFSKTDDLVNLIANSISDEPPLVLNEGGIIKKGFDAELDELREMVSKNKDWILNAQEKINLKEYELFLQIRSRVAERTKDIQKTAELLSTIDVLTALASVATDFSYARPEIDQSSEVLIEEGRHPVLEKVLDSGSFIPNETRLSDSELIHIITGPNMAGKSTYLRQVGLIVLLAQIGSFVPAEKAKIGIVDRIFTRVGAMDNITLGQSTFLVEMNESANILNNATSKRLILLDEIGRGTSPFDGLSIAWAVAEYISDKVKAKTLFATHYHELTDLALLRGNIRNFNVAVREWNDQVIFLHKIVPGGADRSYGIHVARLAGLPQELLGRAREILLNLEKGEFSPEGMPRLAQIKKESGQGSGVRGQLEAQLPLFAPRDTLREELRAIDANNMTPLQALAKLEELKRLI